MRGILTFGLLGLILVLLLNFEARQRALVPAAERTPAAVGDGTTVRVFSLGAGLTAERFERRERAQEIIVDGDLLSYDTAVNGLRFASFPIDGGEVEHGNFDLTNDPGAARELAAWIDARPVNTVVALAVFRFIDPRGPRAEQRARTLAELFERLGTSARPHTSNRQSWAWLGIRREDGWQRIAERSSLSKGVMIAQNLPPDPAAFDRLPDPQPVVETERVRRLVSLYPYGTTKLDPFNTVRRGYGVAFEINREQRDGFSASPPFGDAFPPDAPDEKRIVFPYVLLGAKPALETEIGIESYHRSGCRGVEFQVLVDGQPAATRAIALDPNEPDAWLPWQIDLSPWERRWVRIELRTRQLHMPAADLRKWPEPAVWGDPRIVDEPAPLDDSSAPADLERDGVLSLLDHRADGILTRDEIPTRLLGALDKNKDRRLEAAEEPPSLPGMIAKLDRDGNGFVDVREMEALYDHLDEWLFGR